MPFDRIGAMMRGAQDVGGTGRMATIAVPLMDGADDAPTPAGEKLPNDNDLVLVYRTMRDNRVRPSHAALEGQTWEIDDQTAPVPPLGYGCRCKVDIVQRSVATAKAPKDETAALKRFPDLENNVEKYMGKEIAALYEAGDLKASDLLTETGDPIQLTEARVIAAARRAGKSPGNGLTALAQLNGMGLSDQTVRAVTNRAQVLIDKGATADAATRQAIAETPRTGGLGARSTATRAARTQKAVDRIKATGLLRYDPPAIASVAALPKPVQIAARQATGPRVATLPKPRAVPSIPGVPDGLPLGDPDEATSSLAKSYTVLAAYYVALAEAAATPEERAVWAAKAKSAATMAALLGTL